MAEIPLTEVFNVTTMSLLDNYHDVIRDTVLQQLEDTTWLLEEQVSCPQPQFFYLFAKACAPAIDHSTPQRLSKPVKPGPRSHLDPFPDPDVDIPKPPGSSDASDSVRESRSHRSRRGPPSVIDTSAHDGTPLADGAPMNEVTPVAPSGNTDAIVIDPPVATGPTFRGQPVDTRPTGGHGPPIITGRFQSTPDTALPASTLRICDDGTDHRHFASHADSHAPLFCGSYLRRRIF